MFSMFYHFPSLKEIRLRGFEILDVFIIGYFGLVFDFAYETCKNYQIYVFSLEALVSLSSCLFMVLFQWTYMATEFLAGKLQKNHLKIKNLNNNDNT